MLAVVPSKARYKTSNDRNRHPRHRTARTTPTAIKSNQRRLLIESRISDSRRLLEFRCLRARASCSNWLACCMASSRKTPRPPTKNEGLRALHLCGSFNESLSLLVQAALTLCCACAWLCGLGSLEQAEPHHKQLASSHVLSMSPRICAKTRF